MIGERVQRISLLLSIAEDVSIGVLVAALVIAIVLFGGAVSQFVYIDF